MFNPLAARDAKRNLDGMYKGRFERAEQQRFQMELQLNVISIYAKITERKGTAIDSDSPENDTAVTEISARISQLESLVQEIQQLIAAASSSSSRQDGLTSLDINQCESLSRLEYESINYSPSKVPLSFITSQLEPFELTYDSSVPGGGGLNCVVTCDPDNLRRAIQATKAIFPTPGISRMAYDNDANLLTLRFKDSADHGGLAHIFDQVDHIMAGQIVPLPYENITMLFVAKCLARSMGGDVILEGVEVIVTTAAALDLSNTATTLPVSTQIPVSEEVTHAELPVVSQTTTPPPQPQPTIVTPAVSTVRPPTTTIPPDALKGRRLNILLVEDNPILQTVFKKWWEKREHNVFIAKDGQEAVNMFKEQNYSIMFCDIEIPIKDGFTATREIRAFEVSRDRRPTPIIGLSGHDRKAYADRALDSGMNDFTSKGTSFQMHKIYDLVVRYCS